MTKMYSTSFSLGIRLLGRDVRQDVYNIYGFVRLADEIVDTLHDYPQQQLLLELEQQTYQAIDLGISTHPILDAFQLTVNTYNIDHQLIDQFLNSMKMDLEKIEYSRDKYEEYILGSAEVVGLMCLQVFLGGDRAQYHELKPYAESLGAVFQKVNFLRDISHDYNTLGRVYFPGLDVDKLSIDHLYAIFEEIESDFEHANIGVKKLPSNSRMAVHIVMLYYRKLYQKIKKTRTDKLLKKRIRIPNYQKAWILLTSYLRPI